jgi:hypothetical protein
MRHEWPQKLFTATECNFRVRDNRRHLTTPAGRVRARAICQLIPESKFTLRHNPLGAFYVASSTLATRRTFPRKTGQTAPLLTVPPKLRNFLSRGEETRDPPPLTDRHESRTHSFAYGDISLHSQQGHSSINKWGALI